MSHSFAKSLFCQELEEHVNKILDVFFSCAIELRKQNMLYDISIQKNFFIGLLWIIIVYGSQAANIESL